MNTSAVASEKNLVSLENIFGSSLIPAPKKLWGHVTHISGQSAQIEGLSGLIGANDLICVGESPENGLEGEIIALENGNAIAMMHGDTAGLKIGQRAYAIHERPLHPSKDWIGCVLNYKGEMIDGTSPPQGNMPAPLKAKPPKAILRKPLGPRLPTGVAAIDSFLPLCQGQRVGLFAGSGIGKSTLLGALAKGGQANVNIIALIGERGREVRSFVEHTLGAEGIKKSIVFVATSDEPSALKLRTALLAMATAEYFRDQGLQVLCLMDSLTRYAEAHRDVALTAGEVPSLRAYPPSTFRALAALCERAGPGIDVTGDITAVFSVLVAGSDMEEPVTDMVRGILDGHIILDRDIAERGRYPAINIRRSVSRSLPNAASAEENELLREARTYITLYEEALTMIQAGLYVSGTDESLDKAIAAYPALDALFGHIGLADINATFVRLQEILRPDSILDSPSVEADSQNSETKSSEPNS